MSRYDADTDPRYAELMAAYVRAMWELEEADRIYMQISVRHVGPEFDRWVIANERRRRAQAELGREYPGALEDA